MVPYLLFSAYCTKEKTEIATCHLHMPLSALGSERFTIFWLPAMFQAAKMIAQRSFFVLLIVPWTFGLAHFFSYLVLHVLSLFLLLICLLTIVLEHFDV